MVPLPVRSRIPLTERSHRLGAHAFHTVLTRKKGLYPDVMRDLSKRISGPERAVLKREFGALVRDGLAEFKNISF
jgi:hypothetical protein